MYKYLNNCTHDLLQIKSVYYNILFKRIQELSTRAKISLIQLYEIKCDKSIQELCIDVISVSSIMKKLFIFIVYSLLYFMLNIHVITILHLLLNISQVFTIYLNTFNSITFFLSKADYPDTCFYRI